MAFIQKYNEQIMAQRMWADGRHKRELQKPVNAVLGGMVNQNVAFTPVMKGNVCIGTEAIFFKSCNDTVVDCTQAGNNLADCGISGIEATTEKKTYTPNVCLTKSIKVSEDDCAGFANFEEKLAFMKLKAKTAIEVEFNKAWIAALVANASANTEIFTGWTTVGTKVTIPAADWAAGEGAKLVAKLHISAEKNQIYDAYVLNGSNFYEAQWLYNYKEKSGSDDRYDDVFSAGPYDFMWDIINVDTVATASASFLVDRNAIAYFGQNEYANLEKRELKSDLFVYREPSMRLRYKDGTNIVPVYFDVVEEHSCAVAGAATVLNKRYRVVNIEYTLRGGIITGPADCNSKTGILHFEQV